MWWDVLALFALLCACINAFSTREKISSTNDKSLLWGPYRPNLYFGVRPRIPETVLMGLMWSNADDYSHIVKNLRHTCEQNEGMAGYGWTSYDARSGGSQTIHDTTNKLDLTMDFVKPLGEAIGTSWSLRVRGTLREDARKGQKSTVVFYVGGEAPDSSILCEYPSAYPDAQLNTSCKGEVHGLPGVHLSIVPHVQRSDRSQSVINRSVMSLQIPRDTIWQAKDVFLQQLKQDGQHVPMLPSNPGHGNFHLIQLIATGNFEIDISFSSDSTPDSTSLLRLNNDIQNASETFEERFQTAYAPQRPFQTVEHASFSKSLLANLMGGIGYFYGTAKVSSIVNAEKSSLDSADTGVEEQGPYSLFSAVPSRPFFPRGFLWDEGFHLQVILDYDLDLAIEMLSSWLSLMDDTGWIAREQILGPEARSKVPSQFQTQYQHFANPPTMFIVAEMFLDRILGDVPYNGAPSKYAPNFQHNDRREQMPQEARSSLNGIYLRLRKHYDWFRRTQAGNIKKYHAIHPQKDRIHTDGFRWRGRTPQHILTSGLDDYPRAPIPSENELHLDALCWVSSMAQTLHKISSAIHGPDDSNNNQYLLDIAAAHNTAEDIHWSESQQTYCDTTISSATGTEIIEQICHKGYISLLPFITNTINTESRITATLDLLSDPLHLWSPHGLRSLSKQDPFYGTEENYWRSPIWININYLVLVRLLALSNERSIHSQRAGQIYTALRRNLVNTVLENWRQTGFAWEQYDPDTGQGQRTQHFTGWTSLVVRIMAMPDLEGQGEGETGKERVGADLPSVKTPAVVLAGSTSSLLYMVTFLSIVCAVFFRRRIMRGWKGWVEDR